MITLLGIQNQRSVFSLSLLLAGLLFNLHAQETKLVRGVYRVQGERVNECTVWIVDGKIVRESVIAEFLYGGNHERYPAVPFNEIWIDHAISCEEFTYTLEHEACERELMAMHGWTYDAAHDSALMVEQKLRSDDLRLTAEHERKLRKVVPTDYYDTKEIRHLGDSLRLHDIYRVYVGKRNMIDIWIVDGAAIRRDIYPDFGLSGNDLAYHFIPEKEIWLDAQVSCEEMEFSIRFELTERTMIARGMPYDDAYDKALIEIRNDRIESSRKAARMSPLRIPLGKQ